MFLNHSLTLHRQLLTTSFLCFFQERFCAHTGVQCAFSGDITQWVPITHTVLSCFVFFLFHINLSGIILYLLICYVKSFQSFLTLCNPMDYSLPGSSVHGILQASILERVSISSPPGDLPNPGIKPLLLTSPALAGSFFTASATW